MHKTTKELAAFRGGRLLVSLSRLIQATHQDDSPQRRPRPPAFAPRPQRRRANRSAIDGCPFGR